MGLPPTILVSDPTSDSGAQAVNPQMMTLSSNSLFIVSFFLSLALADWPEISVKLVYLSTKIWLSGQESGCGFVSILYLIRGF